MVGLFHGKHHLEMDDDWGYPYFRKPPSIPCMVKGQTQMNFKWGWFYLVADPIWEKPSGETGWRQQNQHNISASPLSWLFCKYRFSSCAETLRGQTHTHIWVHENLRTVVSAGDLTFYTLHGSVWEYCTVWWFITMFPLKHPWRVDPIEARRIQHTPPSLEVWLVEVVCNIPSNPSELSAVLVVATQLLPKFMCFLRIRKVDKTGHPKQVWNVESAALLSRRFCSPSWTTAWKKARTYIRGRKLSWEPQRAITNSWWVDGSLGVNCWTFKNTPSKSQVPNKHQDPHQRSSHRT